MRTAMMDIDKLIRAALNGERPAIARLISLVEGGGDRAEKIMERISPHAGNAYMIGVTGPPGAGKSTTVDRLTGMFSANGYSVGVIAVDPTSPFSGGALLGDRIRMNSVDTGRDVFFRSMSAGRNMGGLSRTTRETARILDAGGRQIIIIETVGVGQSELDIAQTADTVMVILMPESGDHIQMMKAGLMEIADIFAINKSDRPGAEHMSESIRQILDRPARKRSWQPPVFLTAASLNRGIEDLYDGLWSHRRHLEKDKRLEIRRKHQLETELRRQMEEMVSEFFWQKFADSSHLADVVEHIWSTRTDPRAEARRIVSAWMQHNQSRSEMGKRELGQTKSKHED